MIRAHIFVSAWLGLVSTLAYADSNSLVGVRGSMMDTSTLGDIYSTSNLAVTGVEGELMIAAGSKGTYRMGGALSLGGEFLILEAGYAYHFIPFRYQTLVVTEDAKVARFPYWSPFVGAAASFNRVQVPLARKDGSQSDIVLAALIGPKIFGGTFYGLTPLFYLHVEMSMRYGFAQSFASRSTSYSAGLTYLLP